MVSRASKDIATGTKKLWIVAVGVIVAIATTLLITRPAQVTSVSMTPLSGLMALKTMATESVPYDTAIASDKPTLIEFYADWCTTCQSMATTVSGLHQQYGNQINFVMIDIDQPQWAEQIAAYGASGVPQFTLLDAQHQAVNTWVGKVPKPIFSDTLQQLLS